MKKTFTFLFIAMMTTTNIASSFHIHFSENIAALSDICQVEDANAASEEFHLFHPSRNSCEYSSSVIQNKQVAYPFPFPTDGNHSLRIEFPPEAV